MTPLLSHSRRPDITFRRDGCIQISARVARLLHRAAAELTRGLNINGAPMVELAVRVIDNRMKELEFLLKELEFLLKG